MVLAALPVASGTCELADEACVLCVAGAVVCVVLWPVGTASGVRVSVSVSVSVGELVAIVELLAAALELCCPGGPLGGAMLISVLMHTILPTRTVFVDR
jgi:hypothetical protein